MTLAARVFAPTILCLWAVGVSYAQMPGCADLDLDGFVNFADLTEFRKQFGKAQEDLPNCRWSIPVVNVQLPEGVENVTRVTVWCAGTGAAWVDFRPANTVMAAARVATDALLCPEPSWYATAYNAQGDVVLESELSVDGLISEWSAPIDAEP